MLSQIDKGTLQKKQIDTLSAKYFHVWQLEPIKKVNFVIDILSFCVPALYFPIRYFAKGTRYQEVAEVSWEILAAVLGALALAKVIAKWQEKAEAHSRLRDENMTMFTEASKLLRDDNVSRETVDQFLARCDKLEGEDRGLLGDPPKDRKQAAYREAMKEVTPGSVNVVCPICRASPYLFKKGSCDTCGNTPVDHAQKKVENV